MQILLNTGKVDVESRDSGLGMTPLYFAAVNEHGAAVQLLLETGLVDADAKDPIWSRTPLSRAVEIGDEAVVKLLLATGTVDVESRDTWGRTPLSYATGAAMVKLLQSHITAQAATVSVSI